jgi:alpha-N-acetylglucosaminidase
MTDAEIEAFLPGPPYLSFCWMGCLDGHGGPLPKDWTAQHVELGQKIVARERELGMTPVLQGFTGHVPQALAKKFPGSRAQHIHWIEFDTCMLDPQDPLFQQVATSFIEEQTRLFGSDHLYDADSFIEMSPPSGDLKYLADIGRAIYEGMARTDPKAVWLLQGWTFMNQAHFWKQERIKAFLDAVPNDHMLVLDLFCESTPVWNTTRGFYGKPWVWSFVYNFGDTTVLGGSGPLLRLNDLAALRKHPLGQKVRGVGLMMEGYGHSPLVFDLMYEMAWRDDLDLAAWMREYPRFRYGRKSADAELAWKILRTNQRLRPRHGRADDPHGLPGRGATLHHIPCDGAGENVEVAAAGPEGSGRHGDLPPRSGQYRAAGPFQPCRATLRANDRRVQG